MPRPTSRPAKKAPAKKAPAKKAPAKKKAPARRRAPATPPAPSTIAEGLDRMLTVLRRDGGLEDVDYALVVLGERLAAALDTPGCDECGSPKQNAALWREYRATVVALREAAARGEDDDTAAFIVSVQTPRRRA